MLQALLLAIWAGLCTWDQFGPHLGFRKPLLASVVQTTRRTSWHLSSSTLMTA